MYLPGTVNERITDLRMNKKLSQKELSEIIGVAPSQISRIENGEIQKISGDILIKLAKYFGVSTDFILGLTTISTPKSYDKRAWLIRECGQGVGYRSGRCTDSKPPDSTQDIPILCSPCQRIREQ